MSGACSTVESLRAVVSLLEVRSGARNSTPRVSSGVIYWQRSRMELHTRITAVDAYGEWFKFTLEQGFDVSTKQGEIANVAKALLGQPVVIDYVERPGKINPHTNQ